jgi:hypothetical protein
MTSNKKTARIAGLLYLVVVLAGIFSLMYVPGKLIVWDNAATTFKNIVNNQTLYRFGVVGYLICYVFFLLLPLVLYKLLKPVNAAYARFMVILAVVSVPIAFANSQNLFNVLSVISGESYLDVFSNEQLQSQVFLYLNHYDNGNLIISIFSGLWLFPFGFLVYMSGLLPKILGILLMLGCFSYLINFLGHSLVPAYSRMGIASYVHLPASFGEIGVCLWLLIMGAKNSKLSNQNQ